MWVELKDRHKVFLVLFCVGVFIFISVGCAGNDSEPEPVAEDTATKGLTREEEIEISIRSRIYEGDYLSTELTGIRINEDMGHEGSETRFISPEGDA